MCILHPYDEVDDIEGNPREHDAVCAYGRRRSRRREHGTVSFDGRPYRGQLYPGDGGLLGQRADQDEGNRHGNGEEKEGRSEIESIGQESSGRDAHDLSERDGGHDDAVCPSPPFRWEVITDIGRRHPAQHPGGHPGDRPDQQQRRVVRYEAVQEQGSAHGACTDHENPASSDRIRKGTGDQRADSQHDGIR